MENHKSSSIRRMPTMTCTAVAVRPPVDRTPRGGGRPVFPWPNPRRPAQRASPARRKTMSTRLFRQDDRPVTRPAQREDEATDIAVSGLREAAGSDPDDPRVRSLIDELSAASERFRELWARADVGYRVGVLHMRHPVVGDLYLYRNRFNIPHSGGQHMLTYRADPDSDSAKALDALRSLGQGPNTSCGPNPWPARAPRRGVVQLRRRGVAGNPARCSRLPPRGCARAPLRSAADRTAGQSRRSGRRP